MYTLNFNEKQKKFFLELVIYASLANKVLEGCEKAVIDSYAEDMSISVNNYTPTQKLDDVLVAIKKCSDMKIRKMMFGEMLSVLTVDGTLDEEENKFIAIVLDKLEIPKKEASKMISLCNTIMVAYNELGLIINE